jgi:hypothetical protein
MTKPFLKEVLNQMSEEQVTSLAHNIEIKNGSYYRFNIQHDLGIKWSLYVKTLVSELCHDVLNITVDVKIDDNLISLVFREYP